MEEEEEEGRVALREEQWLRSSMAGVALGQGRENG